MLVNDNNGDAPPSALNATVADYNQSGSGGSAPAPSGSSGGGSGGYTPPAPRRTTSSRRRSGGGSRSTGGGGGINPAATPGAAPVIDYALMANDYGFALAYMRSNPDLSALFDRAVTGDGSGNSWPADKFMAEFRGTNYFKTTSAAYRNAQLQKTSDPATYQAQLQATQAHVRDIWGGLWGSDNMNDDQLANWAQTAYDNGWTDEQITHALADSADMRKELFNTNVGGKAAQTLDKLRQLQQNYGLARTNDWTASQATNVLDGKDTIDAIEARFRQQAATNYPAFASAIQSGQTLRDVADPYMAQMSQILEIDPKNITVFDNTIQKALSGAADPQTKTVAPLSINAFNQQLRQDSRWQYTNNAKQAAYDTTSTLLKDFGLSATE